LLARKGAATPAGFVARPRRRTGQDASVAKKSGLSALAMWLAPSAAIALAAAITVNSTLIRGDATVAAAAVASPLAVPAPFPPPVVAASVPARPIETTVAKPRQPPSGAAGPVYRVQLHALRSRESAEREWRRIKHAHGDLFGHKQLTLLDYGNGPADTRTRLVRLQAGPFNGFRDARNLCGQAKKRSLACVVVRQ
jgi:cell division septation protein DedD